MKLDISLSKQTLSVFQGIEKVKHYSISTGLNGHGQQNDSGCTPLGKHCIRARIGDNQPINTVFVGRRPTGEIYKKGMRAEQPHRDWILTRILWLSGCEPGFNRLGSVDTMRRYIYIHGAPEEVRMGGVGSKGCIRMRNNDLIELFNMVAPQTEVNIRV
ncbi:MAG: L,D-transpeptidase family protein [Gammaproteobacteria bacterium]|nr:L,D-transpeptidase family protein [Gammaproteobacteria bacterium]NKB63207.1 L,D-transpeptidase family protein [Gammaproteobacteria bacterium]